MDCVSVEKVNEVYVRVKTEPSTMMELCDHFTFEVPGAKFMPAVRNRVWDGKIRLLNPMTGYIYSGLVPYIEQFCQKREYEFEHFNNPDENFSLKEAEEFVKIIKPVHEPRDYQMEAFVHCVRKRRALMLSPTSSGKSLIIYLLVRYYQKYFAAHQGLGEGRILIIVPTTSLVSQLASDFEDYGWDADKYVHKIYSGQAKITDKPVIITTWQSVYKLGKSFFQSFDVVFGDEAHLFKAKSTTSIMSKLEECRYRFGFTGTLDGSQTHKLVLEGLFGAVRRVITTKEMIDKKYASDFFIKAIVLSYPDAVRQLNSKLDYQDEMDYLVKLEPRNKFIRNLALSLKGNSLLLFQYVEKHGKPLYEALKKEAGNRNVYFIHGGVDGEDREKIRKIVENEEDAIIVASFGTFSTGINIRNLHNLIFCSPSKARIRILQSIGRVLRKLESKERATLFDIADDMSWKKRKNYTLLHFMERIKTYIEDGFEYKIYSVALDV